MNTLHGSSVRSFVSGPVVVTEKFYCAGLRLPRHTHDTSRFCLSLSGAYAESWPLSLRERRAGALTFHPAGEEHRSIFQSDVHCIHVELTAPSPEPLRPIDNFDPPAKILAARIASEWRRAEPCAMSAIEALTYELLSVAVFREQQEAHSPGIAHRALEIIRERGTGALTLSALAEELDVHPVYLARSFRRTYRRSVGDAIRETRVEAALVLLETAMPLAEVAQRAGFADQSHLTRMVKRLVGRTPRQLRQG